MLSLELNICASLRLHFGYDVLGYDVLGYDVLFIPHHFNTDLYICMYCKVNMPRFEDMLAFDISNLTPLMLHMALRFCERVDACPGPLHKKVSKNILNLCFQTLLRFTFVFKDTHGVKTHRMMQKQTHR